VSSIAQLKPRLGHVRERAAALAARPSREFTRAIIGTITVLCSCDGDRAESSATREVADAMQRYQVVARTVNPDSMAAFYTPGATLFEPGIMPIHTRDSIRAFIASFPGVKVDVASATSDSIEVYGRTAYLWGSYFERLDFPGQPRSEQHGKFVAQWVRQDDGQWLIHRMFRVPLPSRTP
jgi:ketosteroid isomerase-like protein